MGAENEPKIEPKKTLLKSVTQMLFRKASDAPVPAPTPPTPEELAQKAKDAAEAEEKRKKMLEAYSKLNENAGGEAEQKDPPKEFKYGADPLRKKE